MHTSLKHVEPCKARLVAVRYYPATKVVFFDDPKGARVDTEAPTSGDDLDYAWCRVFPLSSRP
jgi:hypothetical protein